MKLFLASEVKHPQTITDLEKFIEGFENKKVVYIPTAANGEEQYGAWKNGATWNKITTLPLIVSSLVLEEVKEPAQLSVLDTADIIWFAGGYWGYLMYWMRRLELDKKIPQLAHNGTILVGSSAGSGIMSKTLEIAEWWRYAATVPPEPEIGASIFPGLGLVDFDIYPHYKDDLHEYISQHYAGNKMYLLKDGESIEVDGDTIKLNGVERVLSK